MSASSIPRAPTRLLVVDDNRELARVLARGLGLAGLEVRVAFGAAMALEIASVFGPEVALIDLGLPEVDGYALARSLRSAAGPSAVYQLAMTGFLVDGVPGRAKEAGFDELLRKPLNVALVSGLIARWRARPGSGSPRREDAS